MTARHVAAPPVSFAGFWIYQLRPSWRLQAHAARRAGVADAIEVLKGADSSGTSVRSVYELTGLRAEADFMIWLAGPTLEPLHTAMARLRRTGLGEHLMPVDVLMGICPRGGPGEDPASDPALAPVPAPLAYVAVYPFVKEAAWYLLRDEEQHRIMAERRKIEREGGVHASWLRSFGLGDAEHVVVLEADEPLELVRCVEELRGARIRLYTRSDAPVYLGRRQELSTFLELLA